MVSFTPPRGKSRRYRLRRGMSGLIAGVDAVEKIPFRELNPQPVSRCYTDWALVWLLNDKLKIIWKRSWPNRGTAWRNRGKPQNPSHDSSRVVPYVRTDRTLYAGFWTRLNCSSTAFSWLEQGRGVCYGKRFLKNVIFVFIKNGSRVKFILSFGCRSNKRA
jgi:hypothetical protein